MKIMRCKSSFRIGRGSGPAGANEGDLLPEAHPLVQRSPKHFESVEDYVARRHPDLVGTGKAEQATANPARVEQTTNDPGTRRQVTTPAGAQRKRTRKRGSEEDQT